MDIVTPSGVLLTKELSFSLTSGQSLLLTGHNGAGKSSIFRCLGGLWDVPTGTISKPGALSSGLHAEVFYLPQKPYNVLGTLGDQLSYPNVEKDGSSRVLDRDRIAAILAEVDLSYLLDRYATVCPQLFALN